MKKSPTAENFEMFGEILLEKKRFEEALRCFEKAEESPMLHYSMGQAKEGLQDYLGAQRCFELAKDIPIMDVQDRIQRFYLHWVKAILEGTTILENTTTLEKLQKTLTLLEEALKLGEKNAELHHKMGDIHHLLAKNEDNPELQRYHYDEAGFCNIFYREK